MPAGTCQDGVVKRVARWIRCLPLGFVLLGLAAGCVKVKTEVEPIEVNVNVRLQVDRELNQFFQELDAQNPTLTEETEDAES